jgi:ABC-2 type transport system permease protein
MDKIMRIRVFAMRNIKEISREPLSYVFCFGFPIVMLVIMSVVNASIPKEANMTLFQIQNLGPGIAVFSLTFTMLFTCLSISKDRANAFLVRLYASPMRGVDFITGYTIPLLVIAVIQCIITFLACAVIGALNDYIFSLGNVLFAMLVLLPSMILFIGLGLFFGTLFSEKAAPGLCSIIISVAGMLGGIWMDVDALGGVLAQVCKTMPFYYGVKAAKLAVNGDYSGLGKPLVVVCGYAIIVYLLAVLVFRKKMQDDLR